MTGLQTGWMRKLYIVAYFSVLGFTALTALLACFFSFSPPFCTAAGFFLAGPAPWWDAGGFFLAGPAPLSDAAGFRKTADAPFCAAAGFLITCKKQSKTGLKKGQVRLRLQGPQSTLPPGYASAARRNRREGKEPPDVGAEPEQPQDIPGQARGDGEVGGTNKGSSQTQGRMKLLFAFSCKLSSTRGKKSAAPPSEDSKPGPASSSKGGDSKSNKDGMECRSSIHKSGAASGARDGPSTDPRVAADTAAAPEAGDLIAKVDHELDQSQCKDLETRRRIFKNLILKWHPDKNQEEVLATEVFRHLMARRGRYLEA
eukprot:g11428.t1